MEEEDVEEEGPALEAGREWLCIEAQEGDGKEEGKVEMQTFSVKSESASGAQSSEISLIPFFF